MKKVLFITAALFIAATSFAQTEKVKTSVKETEKKAVTEVKKSKASLKKDAKVKATEVVSEPAIAPKAVAEPKLLASAAEKEIANAQTIAPVQPAPLADVSKAFEFKNDAYDFGKIPAGKPSKYDLFIKNVSKETQELTLVQPGCGCTTPEYEQNKKFAPGETVKVTLGFNGGAPGNGQPFSKSVTVSLKGFQPKVVSFKGETYAVPTESAPANGAIDKLKPASEPNKN